MLNEVLAAILIALWVILTGGMMFGSLFVWVVELIQDFLSPLSQRDNKVVRHRDGGVAAEVWVESHRDDDRWKRG